MRKRDLNQERRELTLLIRRIDEFSPMQRLSWSWYRQEIEDRIRQIDLQKKVL